MLAIARSIIKRILGDLTLHSHQLSQSISADAAILIANAAGLDQLTGFDRMFANQNRIEVLTRLQENSKRKEQADEAIKEIKKIEI